jgi:hypothetical protein
MWSLAKEIRNVEIAIIFTIVVDGSMTGSVWCVTEKVFEVVILVSNCCVAKGTVGK